MQHHVTIFALKVSSWSLYRVTSSLSDAVENYFPRLWGMGISESMFFSISGYSRDTFGNYRLGYFVGGSSQTLLCILFLVNYAVKNKKK